jgi:universal stress protein A
MQEVAVKIETLLVPMDFSVHSKKALLYAIGLAHSLGAKLHLLHCYGIDMLQAFPYDPPYLTNLPQDFDQRVREAAEKKLEGFRAEVERQGIAAEMHLSRSFPSDAIMQTAHEIDADMIVMGTRGLTGVKHVLLGSVAERTIRIAPCPVVTVKADDPD